MAHELENVNGRIEAAFALKPAWHGLGTVLDFVPDSAAMIEAAGLDWQVNLKELQSMDGLQCPGFRGTFRSDTGGCLGVVSDRYTIVQNRDAFDFLDSLTQDRIMKYESAGALKGGKTVWALARFPGQDDLIAEGDKVLRYALFSTAHDGTGAVHAIPTSVRVVCANTHRIAIAGHKGIRHIGDMTKKLDMARNLISQFDAGFTLYRDKARTLATRKFSREDEIAYVDQLFPQPKKGEEVATVGRGATIRQNKVDAISENLRNPRNGFASVRGTWWALYNSVSEMSDHTSWNRGANERIKAENRFISAIDGDGANLKTEAFDLACEMAGA